MTDEEKGLSETELERYSRHLVIPEIGLAGQAKLKAARVLVIGAGGLGCPVIQYLAAAGVGTIGIVDFDRVDLSNLQRQVIYSTADVGQSKADVAARVALGINPNIVVNARAVEITTTNAEALIAAYDFVIDGSDNFETRYLINDTCVLLNKINIHGAVHRFEGQASVFIPHRGPCYRCVFKRPPVPGTVQNCAEAGVLGVLPGIIGSIQAAECLKLILAMESGLVGKLLLFDATTMTFQNLNVARDPLCIVCGANAANEPGSSSIPDSPNPSLSGSSVDPLELAKQIEQSPAGLVIIDVREKIEFDHSHLNGAVHIALGTLPERLKEVPSTADVVVYCRSGGRSRKAASLLQQSGIKNVRDLRGGLSAWSRQVDPSLSVFV